MTRSAKTTKYYSRLHSEKFDKTNNSANLSLQKFLLATVSLKKLLDQQSLVLHGISKQPDFRGGSRSKLASSCLEFCKHLTALKYGQLTII